MSSGYPVLLDVGNKRIVIVGGGSVAVRKAKGLIQAGAKTIRVIAPKLNEHMPRSVEHLAATFLAEQLNRAELVFAATDRADVNDAVVREARARNIWVCRADGSEELPGDFSSLANHQMGSILLALSAGGSPALSAALRDKLTASFQPHWAGWSDAVKNLRDEMLQSVPENLRPQLLRGLASDEAEGLFLSGGETALRTWLLSRARASA